MRLDAVKTQRLQAGEPVLLAESDEDYILRLHESFKRAEVKNPLFIVFDGQHAIEYLGGIGQFAKRTAYPIPCLILLSVDLKEIDGIEVLRWIREQGHPIHILPVIMLGNAPKKGELIQALEFGAYDFSPKDLTPAEMVEWARELKHPSLICGPLYSDLIAHLLY